MDERPAIDPSSGCFIRYQHGNVVVRDSNISCAWVLRVVKNIERYNQNNQLMRVSVSMSNGDNTIHDCSEHEEYHLTIQELFHEELSRFMN